MTCYDAAGRVSRDLASAGSADGWDTERGLYAVDTPLVSTGPELGMFAW